MTYQVTVGKKNKKFEAKGRACWPVSCRSSKIKALAGGAQRHTKWFKDYEDAQAYAAKINAAQLTGGIVVAAQAGTLEAAIDVYCAEVGARIDKKVIAYGTGENNIAQAHSWADELGNIRCEEITHDQIQLVLDAFLSRQPNKLGGPLAPKTKRDKLVQLSNVFKVAMRLGWSSKNPCDRVEVLRVKHGKGEDAAREGEGLQQFDKPKILELIDYALEENGWCDGLALAFALQTGLRFSEQAALRWSDIDLKKKRVFVRVAIRKCGPAEFEIGDTKTKLSRRVVPLTGQLIALLTSWKLESPFSQPADLVFGTRLGTHQTHSENWRQRVLHPACDAVGIDRIRWHDCRHFFASILLSSFGNDWGRIADLMGHSSTDFTRRQYGHWIEPEAADNEQASEDLGAAIFG